MSRHFKRVLAYARPEDYAIGAAAAAAGPGLMLTWERLAPSYVGKGGFAPIMRLTGVIGLGAGFLMFYQRSICALLLFLFSAWLNGGIIY
jgi:NADH-ubiquinone oxidoreductase complex I, 21 kDa subunit